MDEQLLKILVCPKCKGPVIESDSGRVVFCRKCDLRYPVRDGVPVMLKAEATDIRSSAAAFQGKTSAVVPSARFKVIAGPDRDFSFHLEKCTCRAVGRTLVDPNRTQVFNMDLAMELDEGTKRLVLEYISRQFRKNRSGDSDGQALGNFRRMPDVPLTDSSLSRLHAMLFYDEAGLGILDLVSKNGTYINGKEVESAMLASGDVIEMGETKMAFELR